MSDYGPNERRQDATARSETDTRERLVRVEANLETATKELGTMRSRVHDIADSLQSVVVFAEEAKDDRAELIGQVKGLSSKVEPLAISQAQLATSLASQSEWRAGVELDIRRASDAEQRCAEALAQLLILTKDIPIIAVATAAFSEMRPYLQAVIDEHQKRRGIAEFGKRVGVIAAAVAALLTALASLGGFMLWLHKHLVL